MQICTSPQADNHANTPSFSFLQAVCPSCHPTNSVKAQKAKEIDNIKHVFIKKVKNIKNVLQGWFSPLKCWMRDLSGDLKGVLCCGGLSDGVEEDDRLCHVPDFFGPLPLPPPPPAAELSWGLASSASIISTRMLSDQRCQYPDITQFEALPGTIIQFSQTKARLCAILTNGKTWSMNSFLQGMSVGLHLKVKHNKSSRSSKDTDEHSRYSHTSIVQMVFSTNCKILVAIPPTWYSQS